MKASLPGRRRPTRRLLWPTIVCIIGALVLVSITWLQYRASAIYSETLKSAITQLTKESGVSLGEEKTRQETLKLRLENEQRAAFLQTVLGTLSTTIGIVVALAGIWTGFGQYMNSRERERLDRASNDLEKLWEGIGSTGNSNAQAAAIAALQHFISPENAEYHGRVAAVLALVCRIQNRPKIVDETLKPIVEFAMREITDSMRQVSWQAAILRSANFSELDLTGFDFRDAHLHEANFRRSTLTKARFDAAKLIRASFEEASTGEACFEYADLADANFRMTLMKGANLRHIQVMNMNLREAQVQGAQFSLYDTDWRLMKDWRTATFSPGLREQLIAKYGPQVEGPRVLMLLWEFLPNVTGGQWTAVYHLLRNLRSQGSNISVAVPHASKDVSFFEFGNEISLLPVGGTNPTKSQTYTTYDDSGSQPTERYDRRTSSETAVYSLYGTAVEMADWFAAAVVETIEREELQFDVVHAHDWLTFRAADQITKKFDWPWVAHFHSTERDRRGERVSGDIEEIERRACDVADAIITPSYVTQTALANCYAVQREKIHVVPNCLSKEDLPFRPPYRNRLARKIVFMGRLTEQKGPDLFVTAANLTLQRNENIRFVAFGTGDMRSRLEQSASLPEREIISLPDPERVPATEKGSLQRLSSPVEILSVAPADRDPETGEIRPYKARTGEQAEELVEFLLSRGFVAHALNTGVFFDDFDNMHEAGVYSHAALIEGDIPDGVRAWYCIVANGLQRPTRGLFPKRVIVEFLGETPWKNRKRSLQDASLIIVPSRAEPFGMIVLEAMELGIPVLFERSAGVGEVVHSGIQIEGANADDLSSKIIELLEDEEKWREAAEAGLREASEYPARGYEKMISSLWGELMNARKSDAHYPERSSHRL
jgi:glycosyltransferase involved in cell wall biosynthesis